MVVPAAYVILRRGDEVLLQVRHNTGYMDGFYSAAAAGHVEAGESVIDAACREALEELDVKINPDDLVPICAMHRTRGTGDPIDERADFFYECWQWSGVPRLVEPHKAADLGWFPLDALPSPVVPHELRVINGLRTGDVPPVVTHGFSAHQAGGLADG